MASHGIEMLVAHIYFALGCVFTLHARCGGVHASRVAVCSGDGPGKHVAVVADLLSCRGGLGKRAGMPWVGLVRWRGHLNARVQALSTLSQHPLTR